MTTVRTQQKRALDVILSVSIGKLLHPACRTTLPHGLSKRLSFGDFAVPKNRKAGGPSIKQLKRRVSLPSVLGTGGRKP